MSTSFPGKKGVCMTLRSDEDAHWERTLALKPHWNYSWSLNNRLDTQPTDIEYCPMIWGRTIGQQKRRAYELQSELETILSSGNANSRVIF